MFLDGVVLSPCRTDEVTSPESIVQIKRHSPATLKISQPCQVSRGGSAASCGGSHLSCPGAGTAGGPGASAESAAPPLIWDPTVEGKGGGANDDETDRQVFSRNPAWVFELETKVLLRKMRAANRMDTLSERISIPAFSECLPLA